MLFATARPRAGYTLGITGPVTRGAYEGSRAAAKAVLAAELSAASQARIEAANPGGCAAVVVRAQAALDSGNWRLAARLFCVAADATVPSPHGHIEAIVAALLHSAKLAACMAAPGPSRGERRDQMVALIGGAL